MPLDTQTFGISRHWLAVALSEVPKTPDIFTSKNLNVARKAFLAGSKQLAAIKNWLTRGDALSQGRGAVELTEVGKLMAAQDPRAERAWTWWLLHLHLCVNEDSFPYSDFFLTSDSEGLTWRNSDQVVETLTKAAKDGGRQIEVNSVKTYFDGIDNAFRPGRPLYGLGLLERREASDGDGARKLRRALAKPADIVIAYATLLFHRHFYESPTTIEARDLLENGLARVLGLRDADFREALRRVTQHPTLGQCLLYRQQVNLDSVQFLKSGDGALRSIRLHAYNSQDVRWP
jgi:hypothetical protein